MNRKHLYLILFLVLLPVSLILFPFFFYCGKSIHISIDDVSSSLKNLTIKADSYERIWNEPFFSYLQDLHDVTGAKFTLYVFEEDSLWNVESFPSKYDVDLKNSADWLRFAWHARNAMVTRESLRLNEKEFCESYEKTTKVLTEHGLLPAGIVRLQFFFATEPEIECLKRGGVRMLLSADDERNSYSLPMDVDDELKRVEELMYNGVVYESTDERIEKNSFWGVVTSLFKNAKDEKLVIFTHEWALDKKNRLKM